jgi:threonine/homoserine/homoserine lactone efflux protein
MNLDWHVLFATVLFAGVTSITPGPNNLMLLASGVNFGLRRTLPHWLGVSLGLWLILLLGASGVQQVLWQSNPIQLSLKYLGSAYLIYLAWRVAISQSLIKVDSKKRPRPLTFLEASAFQWVNPKVWMMVLGFYGAYLPATASRSEVLFLCSVFALVNLPCVGIWAMAGSSLQSWLQVGQRTKWFNRVMATVLVLSVFLAWFPH